MASNPEAGDIENGKHDNGNGYHAIQLSEVAINEASLDGNELSSGLPTKDLSMKSGKSLRFNTDRETIISWKKVDKFVETVDAEGKATKKQILFGVSGYCKPGELIALMGPSGSGKTTLLNILGGRANANMNGVVLVNGEKFQKRMKRQIAYVMQEDTFYTQLTVRQQLTFTARLRLPEALSYDEKTAAVDHVIATLRIQKCADTQIMLISGGEKKRCNIGTELLTNPSVLLLDEPTSGLDSNSAVSLITTLRGMSDEKMTIISSIHQPSSQMLYSFDRLVLLADGHLVYSGSPKGCMAHFATLGYRPPADYNPADFFMDLVQATEAKEGEKSVKTILIDAWDNEKSYEQANNVVAERNVADEDTSVDTKYETSWLSQFLVLLERALIISKKNVVTNIAIIQTIILAVICGLAWWRMPYDEERVTDRSGFIFFFMTYWFMVCLFQGMMQFLPERHVMVKERGSGTYRLSAYYLSKTISEIPMRLMMPCIYLAISYPMSNLSSDPEVFFGVAGILLLSALAGESVGLFIGTSTMDFETAIMYATLTSLALMLVGGYFVDNLPIFVRWVRYISPFKYSYDGCVELIFNKDIPCSGGIAFVECLDPTVNSVNRDVAIDFIGSTQRVPFNACMLIVFIVFFRLCSYLFLRYVPHNGGRK